MTPTDDLTEDEQAELRRLATQLGHAEIELMLDAQGRSQAGMQARALHLELRRLRGIVHAVRTLHRQVVDSSWPAPGHCEECWVRDGLDYVPWPCPTIRALGEG